MVYKFLFSGIKMLTSYIYSDENIFNKIKFMHNYKLSGVNRTGSLYAGYAPGSNTHAI